MDLNPVCRGSNFGIPAVAFGIWSGCCRVETRIAVGSAAVASGRIPMIRSFRCVIWRLVGFSFGFRGRL